MTHEEFENAPIDLAGEYVLGTLSGTEREAFERRLANDFTLQQEVDAWEQRLAPLLEAVEPVAPPAAVWRGIQQRLEMPDRAGRRSGVWNSLGFWRGLSLVTASLVLVMGLSLFGLLERSAELERVMVVTNDQSQTGWVVGAREDAMLQVSAVAPTPLPIGKVCQLWLETEDGRLLPVGLLPHQGTTRMPIPKGVSRDGVFKVSIESMEQAPVTRPASDFVFEGRLTRI
jgi:anti-sigma-K factor RskA